MNCRKHFPSNKRLNGTSKRKENAEILSLTLPNYNRLQKGLDWSLNCQEESSFNARLIFEESDKG